MSKKLYAIVALLLTLSMVIPTFAQVQRICPPRFDEIVAEVESDPDIAWTRFKACDFDFYPDIIRYEHVEEAEANYSATMDTWSSPGFHVCYAGVNCRDYVPNDAGQPDAGRPLAPLNWTNFRQALAWAGLSMAEKEAAISTIYGPGVVVPAFTVIPEALGVWHNDEVDKPGCNFTHAELKLNNSGFYIDSGLLYQPNGVVVRDTITVLSPSEAPTSVEFCQRFVDKWNEFFDTFLGVTNCNFVNSAIPFNTEVVQAFYWRNFDLYWLCWGLSRFPDYLYDFFHSSQDFPWGYNSPGIDSPELDSYIDTVHTSLVYEDKLDAAHAAQEYMQGNSTYGGTWQGAYPYIFFYHRIYWCITKELDNIVTMEGTGADNGWTWMLAHHRGNCSGGSVDYILGAEPDNMHPGWYDSAYEAWLIGRCFDGMTAITPDLRDIPWVACDWEWQVFSWPALGITAGLNVTFRIRDGVYWHDGFRVTVEDIAFAWEHMRNYPQYYSMYKHLLWVEIHDPNTITAYFDTPSQYSVYDYAGVALLFPQHIYDPAYHPTIDTINTDPSVTTWQAWMSDYTGPGPVDYPGWLPGDPAPSGHCPTALVGTGPYYFYDWDATAEVAVVRKNPDYWVCGPVFCCLDVEGRIDHDANWPMSVCIVNAGAKDNCSDTAYIGAPVNISSFEVWIDDAYVTTVSVGLDIDPFYYECFDVAPSVLNLPCGVHEVCIKVYEAGDAVNPITVCCKEIVVTAREDLNYDIYVGIDDIVRAAEAFGASPPPFPGNERWDARADINNDYYCGIDDIVDIAEDFAEC